MPQASEIRSNLPRSTKSYDEEMQARQSYANPPAFRPEEKVVDMEEATGSRFERGDRFADRVPVVEVGIQALDRVIQLLGCLGHVSEIEVAELTAQLTRMLTHDNPHIYVGMAAHRQFSAVPATAGISSGLWRALDRRKRCR